MTHISHKYYLYFSLISALFFAPTALANDVVDDSFDDGAAVGGSDSADVDWFAGSSSTITITVTDDSGGLNSGNALQILSTGTFSRVTAEFPSTLSIPDAGDILIVSLKLRMTRFDPANDGGIRFGMHNNNGASISASNLADGWTLNTEGWEGFYFRGSVGGESGMRIFRDLDNAGNSAMGGSGDVTVGNGTGWTINDSSAHTVRIEIERQSNSQNTLRFYWDGNLQQETSTATVGGEISDYTNFTVGVGSTQLDLLVDDVVVTLTTGTGGGTTPIDLTARLIDWSRAGVEGEIPDYTNTIDFIAAGGDSTGISDNSPLLQSLIDGLTTDTVISFPAGTYRFERRVNFISTLSRDLPGVIIRGADTNLTKILFEDPVSEDAGLFDVAGFKSGSAINITGGLTKGSTSLDLSSTTGLAAGDWLCIRQDNDPVVMATIRDIPDYESTIDNSSGWAACVVGQLVKVASVGAGGVTIEQPLHLDFT